MANPGSPDQDPTEIDPIGPISPASPDEPPAASPDLAEPPLDINAGVPEPLKSDIIPGERPADMPPPDK
ncbi:hypothetical protein [Methylobacterium nigriterrae]|uniref:hypothetical protein n=1 Tax=Methylobacterium nigriterrae TaxID=3127512 RepID=UPI0030140F03